MQRYAGGRGSPLTQTVRHQPTESVEIDMAKDKKADSKAAAKPEVKKAAPKAAPKAAAKAPTKAVVKAPAKAPAKSAKADPAAKSPMKPIKEQLNKTALLAHLAQASGAELKVVRSVYAALEETITASLTKKGAGAFTLPGMMRITAQQVPAKKARKGIDPFTKQERTFAAKPASVKLRARFMKKAKEAAGA